MTLAVPETVEPELSVLVVTHGAWSMTERALRAMLDTADAPLELVIVDNASSDETRAQLAQLGGAKVLYNERNRGFGPAVNQAAAIARGRDLLLLNTDAFVHPGWLAPMREALESDGVGAVVPRYLNSDGSLQEAAALVARDGTVVAYGEAEDPSELRYRFRRVVDYGAAACMLTRRQTFEVAGGLDGLFAPAYYEDVDYCLRLARAGLRTVYEPRATVTHARYGSGSREQAISLSARNRRRFSDRWGEWLTGRPATLLGASNGAIIASRDAPASPRILICAAPNEPGVQHTITVLRQSWPAALITWATRGAIDGLHQERWLAAGIELITDCDPDWLHKRPFHYDLTLVGAAADDALRALLRRTQPQAPRSRLLTPERDGRGDPLAPLSKVMLAAGIAPE